VTYTITGPEFNPQPGLAEEVMDFHHAQSGCKL
jgi:hypothetical protein